MSQDQRLDISWESLSKVFIAISIFYLIYLARTIALWFFFGLAISILLEPAIAFFRRLKIPRIICILIVYFAIFGILALLIYLSAPIFITELKQFSQLLPGYFNTINPLLKDAGITVADDFNGLIGTLSGNLDQISKGVVNGLVVFFGGLSATACILTFAFFLSLEEKGAEKFLSVITPKKWEEQVVFLFETVQYKVAGWFGARIIACIFVGLASFIVFYIFGIKYAFTLALISGILNFVPYIGPAIVTLLLLLVVGVSTGSWLTVIYILVAVTVIQEIEGKLLTPLLMKKIIDIPPVLVLVALLVGTEIFGFLGAIFAVPICGIIYEFMKEFLQKQKEGSMES